MRISKSKFVAGCQCVKRLYWQVHEPELAVEPDAATEAIMQQGQKVGMLARQLFPGGVEVRSDRGLDEAICATRELAANPAVPLSLRECSSTTAYWFASMCFIAVGTGVGVSLRSSPALP
jgi:hypothetical protein